MATLQPYADGQLGDIIKSYLTDDGDHFAQDFWMRDRMGAMAGASVAEYGKWNLDLAMRGAFGEIERGRKPAHLFVLRPDDPSDAGVITSPGTPDCGWMPAGETYFYDPTLKGANFAIWCRAGAPRYNALGEWANNGLPLWYVEWSWQNPSSRGPGSPFSRRHRSHDRD